MTPVPTDQSTAVGSSRKAANAVASGASVVEADGAARAVPAPPAGSGPPAAQAIAAANYSQRLATRHRLGAAFQWLCWLATWASVAFLAVLLAVIVYQAWDRLTWDFLTRYDSFDPVQAGLLAGLWGSFWLILMTALFTVPIGVGAAIYLEEYARANWLTRLIQLNIANLAGVPSIVYGILGFTVFVRMFGIEQQQIVFGVGAWEWSLKIPFGRAVLSGALTLTLLSLPVVIIAAAEALRAVPPSLRHASYALGATRWQTVWRQVLPAATPGIATGVILALSRALGETAPLAVLGAATYITYVPGEIDGPLALAQNPAKVLDVPFSGFSAIPLQIYNWVNEQARGFQNVAAAGIVVLLIVLVLMNGTAILIRQRFRKKLRW